jgi:hypothetical protein
LFVDDVRSRGLSVYGHCRIPPFIVYFFDSNERKANQFLLVRWNLSLRRALKELAGDFRTRGRLGPLRHFSGHFSLV